MALPTYQPKVQPAGLPGVRSNVDTRTGAEAVGAGLQRLGAGLQQGSEEIRQAVDEDKRKADEWRVADADLRYGQAQNQALWDDKDGYLNKQGGNALDTKGVYDTLDKAQQSIRDSLANDDQKRMFDLRARARAGQAGEAIERHLHQQRGALIQQTADGSTKLALDTIGLNYADPKAVDSAIQKALVSPDGGAGPLIANMKDNLGLPPEEIQARVQDFKAKAYGVALKGYLAQGDGEGAMKYFQEVRGELGADAPELEKAIEHEARAQRASSAVATMVTASVNKLGLVDTTKVSEHFQAMSDGPAKEAMRKPLDEAIRQADVLRKKAIDDHINLAISIYEQNGRRLNSPKIRDVERWLINPESGGAQEWHNFERMVRADARAAHTSNTEARREQARIDQEAMQDFLAAQADDPELASSLKASERWPDASSLGQKRIETRISMLGKKLRDAAVKGETPPEAEFYKDVSATATRSGLKSKADARDFKAYMTTWREQWLQDHGGKAPTRSEVEQAKSDAFVWGDAKGGSWFSRDKQRWRVKPGDPFIPFGQQDQAKPAAAQPPAAATKRPALGARVEQLKREGKTKEQAKAILRSEGY